MTQHWRPKVKAQAAELHGEAAQTGGGAPSLSSDLPAPARNMQVQLNDLETQFNAFKQHAVAEGWSPRRIHREFSAICNNFGGEVDTSASIITDEGQVAEPVHRSGHQKKYNACSEHVVMTFLTGGAPAGLQSYEVMEIKPEPGWPSTVASLYRAIKCLLRVILHEQSMEAGNASLLEDMRVDIHRIWADSAADTHDGLFKKCTILSVVHGLGLKALPTFLSSGFMLDLTHVKAFVYPYLVSKKFRNVMFALGGLVADALISDVPAPEVEISIDPDIEGWDSPKLLQIIEDAFRSWHVTAFTSDLLHFLHTEVFTAVSKEDNCVSTVICGVQLPEVISLENSIATSDPGDDSNDALAWDKVFVLELMTHEFSRVWRRMLHPPGMDKTPRGIGSHEEPNAGDMANTILWGPWASDDVHCRRGEYTVCGRLNSANLHKALDINSWDDPHANLAWCTTYGGGIQRRVISGRRRFGAEKMPTF